MPRPRRQFSGQEAIVERSVDRWQDEYPDEMGRRAQMRWVAARHWAYRTPNGVEDPLTFLFVVDSLLRMDPSLELRAANLAEWLQNEFPQMSFDAFTVGRVLADLESHLDAKNGIGKGYLQSGRDYRGAFYVPVVTKESISALRAVRHDLMALAQESIARKASDKSLKSSGSPLLECASLRGEFVEPS